MKNGRKNEKMQKYGSIQTSVDKTIRCEEEKLPFLRNLAHCHLQNESYHSSRNTNFGLFGRRNSPIFNYRSFSEQL